MDPASENDYYAAGCAELATETALTVKKLEPRRKLTKSSTRTVIALVGLPARGKSFVARKLQQHLNWSGVHCEIFNVGKYRRQVHANMQREEHVETPSAASTAGACYADFFDPKNKKAADLRHQAAQLALEDMLRWLDDEVENDSDDDNTCSIPDTSRHGTVSTTSLLAGVAKLDYKPHERTAIFDATNSTQERRQWILEMCTSPEKRNGKQTGVVFVESICDDQELLEENYRYKVSSSPDYAGMNKEEALNDLTSRVQKYEEQYETITDDSMSYIKVFNLSTKILVNHVYGQMAKDLIPALMAWHIGTRPIFLCRPGQTISGILTDGEDYVNRKKIDVTDPRFSEMSSRNRRRSYRGDTLGPNGILFRKDLFEFCREESQAFVRRRASVRDMAFTGTSISGLARSGFDGGIGEHQHHHNHHNHLDHPETIPESGSIIKEPFPLRIYTSTMPRAVDTVSWDDFQAMQRSNLNPLDKGDFAGMEMNEIKSANPGWYEKLERDPYNTRFPGGESYRDLMHRLTGVVIDLEQQVVPTLVVSHVSIIQCLMAYFRSTRVEKCMEIEVPLHTVIKFTPVRGGGWSESHHPFYDVTALSGGGGGLMQGEVAGPSTGMKNSESLGELSQLTVDNLNSSCAELSAPIWGDGMGTPQSMKKLAAASALAEA